MGISMMIDRYDATVFVGVALFLAGAWLAGGLWAMVAALGWLVICLGFVLALGGKNGGGNRAEG